MSSFEPIYVASSFKTDETLLNRAHAAVRSLGFASFDFRSAGRWHDAIAPDPLWGRTRTIEGASAFERDATALDRAPGVLVVLPAGEAVAMEAAYAAGLGRPVVVVGTPRAPIELTWKLVERRGGVLMLDETIEAAATALARLIIQQTGYVEGVVATAIGIDSGLKYTGVSGVSKLANGRIASRGAELLTTERSNSKRTDDDARRMYSLYCSFVRIVLALRPNVMGIESYETYTPEGIEKLKRAAERLSQLGVPTTREEFAEKLTSNARFAGAWIDGYAKLVEAIRDPAAWGGVGLGNAAKTIGVLWIAAAVGWAHGVPVYIYTSSQMVYGITGKKFGGKSRRQDRKAAVGEAVLRQVDGLEAALASIVPSNRHHAQDGTGHAILALRDFEKCYAAFR